MFSKKKCKNCGEKISDNYNYCPYCRAPLGDLFDEEDYGLLGRNDFKEPEEDIKLPMGLNALFNSLLKNLNKEMKEFNQENVNNQNNPKADGISKKRGGISISISTSGDKPPEIKVRSFGDAPEFVEKGQKVEKGAKKIELPASDLSKSTGLPKKEPQTNIRRFSNKVTYEIKLPGVRSIKDISIIQLENSIEIKALANNKVFYKIIPINLPIHKYDLSKGVLTLELDAKE